MRAGHTSIPPGLFALFAAPALIAFPFAAFLYAIDLLNGGGGLPTPAGSFVRLALVLIRLTLVFGTPAWLLLRFLRRESGWIYALTGFTEGLLAAIGWGYAFRPEFRIDSLQQALLASVVGASIATAFWLLARDHGGSQP